MAAWTATHRSDRTRSAYASDLAAFTTWLHAQGTSLWDVDADDVERYRAFSLAQGAQPASVARRLSAVASFFRFARSQDLVAANPVEGVSRPVAAPAAGEGLSAAQGRAVLAAATRVDPRAVVLVALLLRGGLKLGEVLGVDVEHLHGRPPAGLVVGRRGRDHHVRIDDLEPAASVTLDAVEACRDGRDSGPLLRPERSPGGDPARRLTRFGADHLLKRVGERAGLAGRVSANSLRRRFVADAHAGGSSIEEIRQRAGHDDVRTTRRYLDLPAVRPDPPGGAPPGPS